MMGEWTMRSKYMYCDDCKHLTPKEWEQSDKKVKHWCKFFKVIRRHAGQHPRIPAPNYCIGYEKYEQS